MAHEREVVIKLRVEADQSATRAATASMSKAMAAVQGRTKAEDELAGAVKRAQQAERERTRAMSQYESAMGRVRQTQTQMAERFNTGLGDMMRFSRGLAMMGLAGEENTAKLLRGLVKIQATVDVIAGGVGVWIRMSNAMRDYATMTQAAAAAHTALAAAQGRSAVAGGAAAAGGLAAGFGGRLAAGAVGLAGKAGTAGLLAGGAVAAGHLGLTAYEVATGQGMGGMVGRYAAFTRMSGMRSYEYIDELNRSQAGLERAEHRRGFMPQLINLQQQRGTAMGALSAIRMQGMNAGGVDSAVGRARGVLSGGAEAGYDVSEITQAQAELQAGIQRRLQLYEEERRAVQQTAAEKARAIQDELSGIQRTVAMHEAALERRQSAYRSAAERFALMDPMQQQQALQAAKAVRAGTASAQQAALARSLAGEGSDVATGATRQLEEEARRRGFHGGYAPSHEAGIGAERRGLETGRAAAAAMEKQMQATVEEARKTGESIGKRMGELMRERDRAMMQAMESQTDKLYQEIMDVRRQMTMRE